MNNYTATKTQPKSVRLVGTLIIDVNGQEVEVSQTFKIQTDLTYSGMTQAQQETTMNAVNTALAGNADIKFSMQLAAEEIQARASKEPSAIDLILAELNKPKPAALVEASIRDDEAKAKSIEAALSILGAATLPETKGVS